MRVATCASNPELEAVDLYARRAEARELDDRFFPDAQPSAGRQSKEREAARREVLAELTRRDEKSRLRQLVEQLRVNEVDLTKVWASWDRARPAIDV